MRHLRVVPIALALAAVLCAESKPAFTGKWKLNAGESRFPNPNAVPTLLLRTVELTGDTLYCATERELNGKSSSWHYTITIGSPEAESPVNAAWEGRVLVVTVIAKDGTKQVEHWSLANGGRQIRDETTVVPPGKEAISLVRVFDKQ